MCLSAAGAEASQTRASGLMVQTAGPSRRRQGEPAAASQGGAEVSCSDNCRATKLFDGPRRRTTAPTSRLSAGGLGPSRRPASNLIPKGGGLRRRKARPATGATR